MKCQLCSLEFREQDGLNGCKSCPFSKSCNMLKCPNCGYEIFKEPTFIKLLTKGIKKIMKLADKLKAVKINHDKISDKKHNSVCLTSVKTGTTGRISHLNTKDSTKLHKMMVIGLLPDITIKLTQKFPTYVIKIGFTQIAIDKELAKDIFLKVIE